MSLAKQSQVKNRRKLNPVFHLQTKSEDDNQLSQAIIKTVRRTGQLNLSGRNLATVPEKMFKMYELSENDVSSHMDFSNKLDNENEGPWWTFTPLTYLDLSSNILQVLPSEICIFEDLLVVNLQDNNLTSLPHEIGKLTKLTKLNLTHNKLTSLPKEFYMLTELEILLLGHNKLESVSKSIGDLIMLQQLDLSNNCLTKLPPGLGYLVRLNELNLSYNKLTHLPPDIGSIRGLKKLDVTHNDLKDLPKMGELRKLEFLYAQHNDIQEIPDCEGCENVQQIYFGNNFIKEVNREFCENMPHLKTLELRDNKIESLPNDVAMLQHLIRLDLTNNDLTELPNSLGLLPHLQNLQLEGNKFKSLRNDVIKAGTLRILKYLREKLEAEELENIPVSFAKMIYEHRIFPDKYAMRNARGLHVTMKELTQVPDEVFEDAKFAEVGVVDLCKNKLNEVPSGLKLMADILTELNLSMNLIKEIPIFLCECSRLKYLDVANNLLIDLPEELSTLSLRELVISNNRFLKIPDCVYQMPGLEILLVRDNKLTDIDVERLKNLKRIATLDLSNNNIASVPPELGNLMQLRTLELKGNSFRQPRYAVLEQGTESILSYLRDRIPR